MIAVTFALPAESSAFVRALGNRKRDGAIVRGELSGAEICVFHTGVGARECEKRLTKFLNDERPRLLIASGFCGGTNDELHPGDLVVAENRSDAELTKKTCEVLSGAILGKLHSADQVIDPAVDRYAIGRDHSAIAIDMETETIARVCAEYSIPMVALRVISDSVTAPFPAPPSVLFDVDSQRTKFTALLAFLARNPNAAIRLAEFSKQIAMAKVKLADALVTIVRAFSS